ncbi:hypothetical protein NQ176_g1690 [Zarea fungicola]|uniref:Uncharacterized protein n=1 Tax=Zarea fungicola TaxID=93591 RepID=A0ACC1NRK5_9HYPO|nr:hypothetical protein NQ176_g1690 [Lecanicillium fungicola]
MGRRMYEGGAVGVFPEAAVVNGDIGEYALPPDTGAMTHLAIDDDSSSVYSSSTESMVDVIVPCLEGDERDDGGTDTDGSLDEGVSLDDDESRSADSDSTGSLADFIAPDWEMGDDEDDETVADDDYEDDGSGKTQTHLLTRHL